MSIRSKLADWIGGAEYKRARTDARTFMELYRNEAKEWHEEVMRLSCLLGRIHTYAEAQKSGTAQKVTRMCKEALK